MEHVRLRIDKPTRLESVMTFASSLNLLQLAISP